MTLTSGGIRTTAAAELLGVSPNTLRSWERRFGHPTPRRTAGGHRVYELGELEALRAALLETHNISSAVEVARRRAEGPSTPARLLDAFDRFDASLADRVMEESLAVRSVDRTVEELLLPALELAQGREGREAEYAVACSWATGWLHATRRVVPPATREESIVLLDSSAVVDVESIHVQALELALRRAGFRVLLIAVALAQERAARAVRAVEPVAAVLCGSGATLEVAGRLIYWTRQAGRDMRLLEYRDAVPVSGPHAIPLLGYEPGEAVRRLKAMLEGREPERAADRRREGTAAGRGAAHRRARAGGR